MRIERDFLLLSLPSFFQFNSIVDCCKLKVILRSKKVRTNERDKLRRRGAIKGSEDFFPYDSTRCRENGNYFLSPACFRASLVSSILIFLPLNKGGEKIFPGEKEEILRGIVEKLERRTKMQIFTYPSFLSFTALLLRVVYGPQVSTGTTNPAQSLLFHRFREAYGRDRRVPSGQVI